MNRNAESRFTQIPTIDIGRSRFDRSHKKTFTCNGGKLIPWLVEPVLPGDTWEVKTSKVIRLQTLLHPLMDMLYADFYFFFVPNRLCWTHWKEFCGENTASAWIPNVTYTIPKGYITANANVNTYAIGSVLDYMGIPFGSQFATSGTMYFNGLPIRAFGLIWNEFFRDENLQNPLNVPLGDANFRIADVFPSVGNVYYDCPAVCKYHDYFTSALPGVQKGPSTTFSIGTSAPLSSNSANVVTSILHHSIDRGVSWSDGTKTNISLQYIGTPGTGAGVAEFLDEGGNSTLPDNHVVGSDTYNLVGPNNLVADLAGITADLSSANSISVNDLRLAFAVQRFYEALARGGSRYTEICQNLFKVRSPDARLQRPEYIGGNRVPISIHQVVNQAESASADLGNLGAYSITTDNHKDFIYSATEHGFIIGCMCIRSEKTYAQGLERFWFDTNKFDIYWPQLANIGEQPIFNGEIYFTGTSADNQAFGFQEAWASYRYKPNSVAGQMRPGITGSLASWNLADYYTTRPSLSDAWIREDISPLDRALAVPSTSAHQFLVDLYVDSKVVRPMPLYSIPGLVDHH